MTIQELLTELSKKAVNFVSCTQSEYDDVQRYDTNTIYLATDTGAIYKGGVLFCKNYEIGNLSNLETSNKLNLVDAINEVNQIASNNQGEGVINDSTIMPFVGFIPSSTTQGFVNETYNGTNGDVICSTDRKRFWYRVVTTSGYQFYSKWTTAYLYNDNPSSDSPTAKLGTIFSAINKHWIVVNGTLQDMSVLLNESQVEEIVRAQIAAKIQFVPALPSNPTSGVLYLIPETTTIKPTEE